METPPADGPTDDPPPPDGHGVAFRAAARYWVKLGFINVGGPTGQIAIMHQELVERRRWVGEDRFLHALSYCMLLPGPEAQQLAIYVGWLLHGTPGGILAGVAFILPGFVLMMGLSYAYAVHGDLTWIAGVFEGLSAAVVGIIAAAMLSIGTRALRHGVAVAVAGAAFTAIFLLGVPFPFVIAAAALVGFVASGHRPDLFAVAEAQGADDTAVSDAAVASTERRGWARTLRVLGIGLAVWWGPLAMAAWLLAPPVFTDQAVFFSQLAVVTFGGAYAVLAYLTQQAVERFGLAAGDVVAGLGLAESTPGPLIMVVQFVGFLAAYENPGGLDPVVAGVLGACVAVWATFAPSFLWIFLGAPSVERLRGRTRLRGALGMITAAVVGVIASLALTFVAVVLFDEVSTPAPLGHPVPVPVLTSADPLAIAIAAGAFLAIRRFRVNVLWVVAVSAFIGLTAALVRG